MQKLAVSVLNQENPRVVINKLIKKDINHVHYDVMDKVFVNNKAFTIKNIKEIVQNTNKHLVDVHLMVKNPERYIKNLHEITDYFSVHFEALKPKKLEKILDKYPKTNIGIAIKPQTSWKEIIPYFSSISHILIMSVEPGQGGQKFLSPTTRKIKELSKYLRDNKWNILIEVDGGITNKTGPKAIKSGANSLVSGSYLIKNMKNVKIKKMILGQK